LLEAFPFLIAGLEDPPTRFSQLGHLDAHLGLKTHIRGCELGRERERLAKARIVEHSRVVDERRDRLPYALDNGHRAVGARVGKGSGAAISRTREPPRRAPWFSI
jgi:hypothetical protein